MSFSLPKSNGLFHLPCPSGKYSVSCLDIFSKPREGRLPLLFRLYYPSSSSSSLDQSRWPAWLPHSRYAEAYVAAKWPIPPCRTTLIDRIKSNISAGTISVLAWFFRWVSGDPRICATEAGQPIQERLPVVLFSHGLIACRTTYSTLCTDLASRGYYVAALEHGDSSACVRMMMEEPGGQVTWLDREELPAGAPEGELRARQLNYREDEVLQTLDSLSNIDKGDVEDYFVNLETHQPQHPPSLNWFKGFIDTDQVFITGHSMGGATTVRCLTNHHQKFVAGVALDSWMFPLREEKPMESADKLLFVNFEKFQGAKNLTTMKRYETQVGQLPSNVVTIRNAKHYACTDILVSFQGTRIGSFLFGTQDPNFNSLAGLITNSELFHAWASRHLHQDEEHIHDVIKQKQEHLFLGINIKSKTE